MNKTYNSRSFLLITMGLLSAFGPFVTDFYLPAFPVITDYFHTSASMIQLSLTAGMLGLGGGQLLIGPISDKYGRKLPVIVAMLLFIVATLGCIYAQSIELFLVFRLMQGVAGSGGVVVSKSVAADLYKGRELTKFFSMLMVVNGLAPILAPVFGGMLINVTSWKGIFWALFGLGIALLVLNLNLKESLSRERRVKGSIFSSFRNFGSILKNKKFMFYVLAQSFAMGFLFSYISSSPFVFQEHYRLSPVGFSICFGINAFGIMLGSWLVSFIPEKMALLSGGISLMLLSVLFSSVLYVGGSIIIVECCLFLLMVALGLILPTTSSLGLNLEPENSGSASAILGFVPFLMGSIVSPLVGIGNILYSTGISVVVCSTLTLLFIWLATRNPVGCSEKSALACNQP